MYGKKRLMVGYLFMLPAVFVVLTMIVYPVGKTIYTSFLSLRIQTLRNGGKFIGLSNYVELFQDKNMLASLVFTLKFTVVAVTLEVVIGMTCALIMNRKFLVREQCALWFLFRGAFLILFQD